jgi:hypothetical protein
MDPYSSGMRFSMASIIVFFPLYLYLMRVIRKDIARDPTRNEIWVRRWLLVLTIFIAGLTVAGDLVALVNYFLGGEITTRFLLKVAVVLLIAAGVLMHFVADMKGYWKEFPEKARMVGWGAGALIIATLIAGFFIMGTPGQVRLYRFDDQKVNDLQNIQYQVINYFQQKEELPETLKDLEDPLGGNFVPVDPQTGLAYSYEKTGDLSFKLCATFNAEIQAMSMHTRAVSINPSIPPGDPTTEPWDHGAGLTCYDRTIDPERYPFFNKTAR